MATNQMLSKVGGIEAIIGYTFDDPLKLWEALQAAGSGICSAGDRRFADGNKRLAVVGDAILRLVLVEDWYKSLSVRERASDIVAHVASNDNLVRVGRLHWLDNFICGNPSQAGYIPPKTMADTVEAILGAVYLDGGIQCVGQVMKTLGLVPT